MTETAPEQDQPSTDPDAPPVSEPDVSGDDPGTVATPVEGR